MFERQSPSSKPAEKPFVGVETQVVALFSFQGRLGHVSNDTKDGRVAVKTTARLLGGLFIKSAFASDYRTW
jgi:hypothetical protein